MNTPDDILIQKFREGDDLAFVMLYNRYKQRIYVFSLKMLFDRDTAKDIVQNVFLKVYERRDQLVHPDRFKSWLLTIARNDCLIHLRKGRRLSELHDEIEDHHDTDIQNALNRNEEVAIITRAMKKLKPDYREVVVLREYENLSYKEIAEVLDTTESVVKSRLFTARQQLYELLKPIFAERR